MRKKRQKVETAFSFIYLLPEPILELVILLVVDFENWVKEEKYEEIQEEILEVEEELNLPVQIGFPVALNTHIKFEESELPKDKVNTESEKVGVGYMINTSYVVEFEEEREED